MPSIAEIYKRLPQCKVDKATKYLKNLKGELNPHFDPGILLPSKDIYTGIEVEVEDVRDYEISSEFPVWNIHADNSLRRGGCEFVSLPILGEEVPFSLNYLFKYLSRDTRSSFGARTSIHIHLDVSSLEVSQVLGIVLTYLSVEPLLYRFVGKDRDKNNFCVPLYQTHFVNELHSFLQNNLLKVTLEHLRYSGLNLDAIRKFNTLEFRHLNGTRDVERICTWISLLYKIHKYGSQTNLGELIKEICDLNTNSFYNQYIESIFGPYSRYLDMTRLKEDLELGVKAVKMSTLNNKFLTELKNQVSQESLFMKWLNTSRLSSFYQQQPRFTRLPPGVEISVQFQELEVGAAAIAPRPSLFEGNR